MKRFSTTQLLAASFVGLLAFSGTSTSELGPPEGKGEQELGNEYGEPTRDRERTGECKELLGVSVEADQTRTRTRECPEEGPSQNPDPGFGDKQHNKP